MNNLVGFLEGLNGSHIPAATIPRGLRPKYKGTKIESEKYRLSVCDCHCECDCYQNDCQCDCDCDCGSKVMF